jgi:uncharacterized protein GlcG (DUF336 family)
MADYDDVRHANTCSRQLSKFSHFLKGNAMKKQGIGSVIALFGLITTAHAQGVITTHRLSAALALEAVGEAVAACAKNGYAVTAIVVDINGMRQAVLRGDGAPVHTLDSAYAKAYTAASLVPVRKETSTKELFDRISKNPSTTTSLGSLPNITFTPGGVTLMIDKEAIGGIGVGGAPGGNFDDECAQQAIAKIRDRMK